MTDKERFVELMGLFKVPLQPDGEGGFVLLGSPGVTTITGYSGFYTGIQFSPMGEFINIGAWE